MRKFTLKKISQKMAQSALYLAVGVSTAVAATIENPGFESGWSGWDDSDPSAISGVALGGSSSAKITGSGGAFSQQVAVDPYTDYSLNAWLLGAGGIEVTVGSETYSDADTYSDWGELGVTFNSGSHSSVTVTGTYNGDEGRFDDFSIVDGGGSSSGGSSSSSSGSGSGSSSGSGSGGGGTDLCAIQSSSASSDDGNVPANAHDGNLGSRWSANGAGEYITFDLGSSCMVSALNIAWYKGDSRMASFEVYVGDNENSLTYVYGGNSSGNSLQLEPHNFDDFSGRYVRVVGLGNTANSWNSMTEIEVVRGEGGPGSPSAVIDVPANVTVGIPFTLDGSGSYNSNGGSLNFSWDFGDGITSQEESPVHTYNSTGVYTVDLQVTNAGGITDSTSAEVTVSELPSEYPVATISGSTTTRVNTSLNLSGSSSYDPDGGDITAYDWDFGDGSNGSGANVSHTYSEQGSYTVTLTVTDDEGFESSTTETITVDNAAVEDLWPLINNSFELSSSTGGWEERDPANVVSTNGTSNPMPVDGGRLLVIKGDGGRMEQAIYKPAAGNRYQVTAWVYNHGTIGIQDLGSDNVYETTTNHGDGWQQITVEYVSTGSPALAYARYGDGSGDAIFDLFEAENVTTQADLDVPPPAPIMRYASQVIDLSWWKLTLPINGAEEHYTPDLYTFSSDEWFKLIFDEAEQEYAVQFRANHHGDSTSGSSNPRSELREMTQNYHFQNSKSAAAWSNTDGKKHTMWIKQKVTNLTHVKPHVVVGQIHDSGDDVVVFRIEGHNGTCPPGTDDDWDNCGTVGNPDTHANLWITNGNDRHGYLVDGNYELGTVFTVKMESYDGQTHFYYNEEKVPYVHDEAISGCYFKLGNYTQSHDGTAPGESYENYAETYVYDYYVSHE
ncbi:polysaccharide lyase family 7 protein [Microbulbifer elongatus]|uniref:Polysaccharide lyase family 7 protein n=1 Tax=Microbulbifer elongatus TaxID=86173 RepID=A0ABT1NYG4_9GAMM|nr:PKD domain-containing protein [Microbulbifer elongatus]MCQ3828926.1 polysaccharide lyase family 7 protein [Microbulbifer elongatus]